MKLRLRLVAAAGAASLVLLGFGAAAAHAADSSSVTWDAPAANTEFSTAVTDLRGHVTPAAGDSLDDINVSVATPDNRTVTNDFSNPKSTSFEWQPSPWPYNGSYTATVTAQTTTPGGIFGGSTQNHPSASVTFFVSAPPQTPSGVTSSFDNSTRKVTVSWNKNPEPDIVGYYVGRYIGSSTSGVPFYPTASQTSIVDNVGSSPAGTYHYQVYAVRAAGKSGEKPLVSKSAGTSSAIVTAAPTEPTTPTTAGGAGSGTTPTSAGVASTSPSVAQRGTVDLSGFGALLNSQRNTVPSQSTTATTAEPDTGFSQNLPYSGKASAPSSDANTALGAPDTTTISSGKQRPTSLLFMAAGLLATVLLMHLLWVKNEVDKAPLEPLPARAREPRRREEPRLP